MARLKIDWFEQPQLKEYCNDLPIIKGIKAQRIITAGKEASSVIIVMTGNLEVSVAAASGKEVLATLEPQEIAGEMTLLEGKSAVADVDVGSEEATWIELPIQQLRHDLEKKSDLATEFYYFLTRKLRHQLLDQNSFIYKWNRHDEPPDPLKKVLIVFGYLNTADLEYLASTARKKATESDQTLIKEGEILSSIYIILDGRFGIYNEVQEKSVKLGTSSKGEILGELSTLDEKGSASAEVRAEGHGAIAEIKIGEIKRWLLNTPGAEARWWRALAVLGSHRCREQLEAAGRLGTSVESEQLSLEELERVERAGQRFRWFCELISEGVDGATV